MGITRRGFVRGGVSAAVAAGCSRTAFAAEKPSPAGVDASPAHVRQEIDGFGFSEAFHMAGLIQQMPEKPQNDLLTLMFSPTAGMGYSMLRNEIGNGPVDSRPGQVASIEPGPDKWNWTGDEDQIWLMNEAKKRGCSRFISSAWSAPSWMKNNNNEWGGSVKSNMYQAYADYLAAYVIEYKKRYGIDIYALSPSNEPGFIPKEHYASMDWTSGELKKFLRDNLIPTFAAKNVPAKIFVPEVNSWKSDWIDDILSDKVCAQAIDIVAAHAYAGTSGPYMPIEQRTGRFESAIDKKKKIWQTEVSAGDANIVNMNDGVYWARCIHTSMIQDNVSAWLYWWGLAKGTSRSSLIAIDPVNGKFQMSKRFFTIAHFARFVRPGFHRVDANPTPAPHTYFSAYLAPNEKQLVCVAINDDSVEHPLLIQSGFKGTTCIPIRTSNTETHAKLPAVSAGNGGFEVTTAPLSVTTFVIS
jgi:glucuronoarabinoxylan endo-1,4-beta-xylanase